LLSDLKDRYIGKEELGLEKIVNFAASGAIIFR
jgi:hypothetical protein